MMIKRLICGALAAAVMLFPIGAFACPAEDTAYPSGAVCSAAESGVHYEWTEGEMVYGGLSYAKNSDEEGIGCVFRYQGDEKRLVIPEEIGGIKITDLVMIISDKTEKLIEFENDTVEEIVISANVSLVDSVFLDRFKALKKITVDENNEEYAAYDGVLYDKSRECIEYYPTAKGGSLNPPKEWQSYSYDDKTKIKSIMLSADSALASNDQFEAVYCGYTALEKIQIDPNNSHDLINVGSCIARRKDGQIILWSCPTFGGDTFTIPEGVTDIRSAILCVDEGENPLRRIVFPASYDPAEQFIDKSYIGGINAVTEFVVSAENPKYKSVDGIVFDKEGETLVSCPEGRKGSYHIPDGVVRISDHAFHWCGGITELTMPDSVVSVGDYAVTGCDNLRRADLSENLLEIGYCDFSYNNALEYIELPDSLVSIGYDCFFACKNLKGVKIPETVNDFYGTWYFDEEKSQWIEDENGLFFKEMFLESPSVTIYCVPGSAAEKMAIKENIPYENISGYDDSAVIVPDISTLGDIDLSGDITAQDALIALRVSISLDTLTNDETKRADTNLDGFVTTEDALDILRVSIGYDFGIFGSH